MVTGSTITYQQSLLQSFTVVLHESDPAKLASTNTNEYVVEALSILARFTEAGFQHTDVETATPVAMEIVDEVFKFWFSDDLQKDKDWTYVTHKLLETYMSTYENAVEKLTIGLTIMPKNVLITGVAGFLGSHLALHHLEAGDYVVGVDCFYSSNPESKHLEKLMFTKRWSNRFIFVRQDVCNFDIHQDVDAAFYSFEDGERDIDIIYNFACPASPPTYQSMPVETLMTCTLGVKNILDIAHANPDSTVVHASTSEVYGDPSHSPQKETYWGNVNSFGPRSCYDEGKRAAEALCYDYIHKYDVDARLVRIFNTYGPHMQPDDGRVISNFIFQALQGKPLTIYGNGSQTRSFCYVDDLISGIIKLAEVANNPLHPVNIGNPREFTMLELAEKINQKIRANSGEIVFRPLPKDDPTQRRPDITVAQELLGWTPYIQLEQGLDKTIEYFKNAIQLNGGYFNLDCKMLSLFKLMSKLFSKLSAILSQVKPADITTLIIDAGMSAEFDEALDLVFNPDKNVNPDDRLAYINAFKSGEFDSEITKYYDKICKWVNEFIADDIERKRIRDLEKDEVTNWEKYEKSLNYKREANIDDVLGAYAFPTARSSVVPKEPDTQTEKELLRALEHHLDMSGEIPQKLSDVIVDILKTNKYPKVFKRCEPGTRIFRGMSVNQEWLQTALGDNFNQSENFGSYDGSLTFTPRTGKYSTSWSLRHKIAKNFSPDRHATGFYSIVMICDVTDDMYFLDCSRLYFELPQFDILSGESEVICFGPVKCVSVDWERTGSSK